MYKDVFCNKMVDGKTISSGSGSPLAHGEINMLDNNVKSDWRAKCSTSHTIRRGVAPSVGCRASEAFVGMDFSDTEVKIQCFQILQSFPDYSAAVLDRPRHAEGFALDRWVGHKWEIQERYWDINTTFGISQNDQPTMRAPFIGLGPTSPTGGPGNWETTRPPDFAAWRLLNYDAVPNVWKVQEVEFYKDLNCNGDKEKGRAVSMQGPEAFLQAEKAFDGITSVDSTWESDCNNPQGMCLPNQAWIGMFFPPLMAAQQPQIRCFRFVQTQSMANMANSVALGTFEQGHWKTHSTHRDVGGGTWNRRPAAEWSMWRILNNEPVVGQWRVYEIRAYNDPLCLEELTGAAPIGSGYKYYRDNLHNVMDADVTTGWGADCLQCNATRKYWVGGELSNATKWQIDRRKLVRCLQIWQSPNFEEQVSSVRVDIWKGEDWTVSQIATAGNIRSGGGGIWTRLPALAMSKWRLMPYSGNDQRWKIRELELYSDTNCTVKLRTPKLGGSQVAMSGYSTEVTGFQLGTIKNPREFSEGQFGFDNDRDSGAVVVHQPSWAWPGWYGIDFRSETTWVRCMKIQQGGLSTEQAADLTLEFWDGKNWSQDDQDPATIGSTYGSSGEITLRDRWFRDLGGGGWQRRPALPGTMWRMENADYVPEGWAVYEVEFFSDAGCKGDGSISKLPNGTVVDTGGSLYGQPISSGFIPIESDTGPQNAFDRDMETAWTSQCSEVNKFLVSRKTKLDPVGCHVGKAWIGLDFHLEPKEVRCFRVKQVGFEKMQSGKVAMTKWDGITWQKVWTAGGLGGSSWDQRPVPPNSMWRVVHLKSTEKKCPGAASRIFNRVWGVSELQMYSDDHCSKKVTGGVPISSGTIERYRKTVYDAANYSIDAAYDGVVDLEWGANCNMGWKGEMNQSQTTCPGAWIGQDFGARAIEIRCFKIMQSRRESSVCCDPASDVRLDRWNGSDWVEASWRHVPRKGSAEKPRYLGASFVTLGGCAKDSYTGLPQDVRMWEQRARRESESCLVPLTGAVVLLGEPACIEHRDCQSAFGVAGDCCPLVGALSRCCCSYLGTENIFDDETAEIGLRQVLKIEYAMIILSSIVPYAGAVASFFLYFFGLMLPAFAQERMQAWAASPKAGCCRRRCCCGNRFRGRILLICWPILMWRTFLRETGPFNWILKWFVRPNGNWPRGAQWIRMPLFVGLGAYLGGIAPWGALGALLGQGALYCLFLLGLIVRWSKSPFHPDKEWDMELRELVSESPLKSDRQMSSAVDVASQFLGAWVMTVVFFLKFIFDLLVCRAQLISYGAIASIEADRVVDVFPGIVDLLREPGMLLYEIMYWASQVMSVVITLFVGIPGCEGSCVLIGSVALVMVLVTLTKFLNYDFFGLFIAARQVVKSTKPACQKILYQGLIMGALAITFGTIQCAMVLFSRSLKVANPFRQSVWACEWDDTMALYMGRGLICLAAVFGITLFFLCANGHFMGQDYIVKPVGRFLRLNLDALDPDGVGDEGGLFQCSVLLSILPTVGGVWLDWWNVKGFLVQERAEIYAEQLREPQPCLHCGGRHVKYTNIMTATGRQISLACQIMPYGILIGKMSEYLNDPPLVYIGTNLKCCQMVPTPMEARPDLGKGKYGLKLLLLAADFLMLLADYGLPLFRRLVAIGMYIFILQGIFLITEDNLKTEAPRIITAGFFLSMMKAAGEAFIENLLSWLTSLIFLHLKSQTQKLSQDSDIARTVAGQVASGVVVSSVVVICSPLNGWTTENMGIIVGACAGLGISYLTLFFNWLLEHPPPHPADPPKTGMGSTIFKFAFSMGIAGLTTFFTLGALSLRSVIACAIFNVGTELVVMKLILVEESTVIFVNEMEGVAKPKEGAIAEVDNAPDRVLSSPTWVVLTTKRMIPGPCGILVGAIMGLQASKVLGALTNSSHGAFSSLIFGAPCGVLAGLAVNGVMEKPALLVALFSGSVVVVAVSMWSGLVAMVAGCVVGISMGSLLEELGVRKKFQHDIDQRLVKAKAKDELEHKEAEEVRLRRDSTMARVKRVDAAMIKLHGEGEWKNCLEDENGEVHPLWVTTATEEQRLMLDDEKAYWEKHGRPASSVVQGVPVGKGSKARISFTETKIAIDQAAVPALGDAASVKQLLLAQGIADGAPSLRGSAKADAGAQPGLPQMLALESGQEFQSARSGGNTGRSGKSQPQGRSGTHGSAVSAQTAGSGGHQLAKVKDELVAHRDSLSRDLSKAPVSSAAPSKQAPCGHHMHKEIAHKEHKNIVDGFELELHGSQLGSDAGSARSAFSTNDQQLALPTSPTNRKPQRQPDHIAAPGSMSMDELDEPTDQELFRRWEFREAQCDKVSPDENNEVWKANPTLSHYRPPGHAALSSWQIRQQGLSDPTGELIPDYSFIQEIPGNKKEEEMLLKLSVDKPKAGFRLNGRNFGPGHLVRPFQGPRHPVHLVAFEIACPNLRKKNVPDKASLRNAQQGIRKAGQPATQPAGRPQAKGPEQDPWGQYPWGQGSAEGAIVQHQNSTAHGARGPSSKDIRGHSSKEIRGPSSKN